MKRLLFSVLLSFAILSGPLVFTGCKNNVPKSEQLARRQIKKKAVRQARKEARKLRRDGWAVAPGSLPMSHQLEATWTKLYERNEEGEMMYLSADGNGVAQTQTAAQIQAMEMAKLQLAGQLETIIRAIIEANIANQQLNAEEAATINRILTSSRNIIATTIKQVEPSLVIYRTLKNKNVECSVKLLYNQQQALMASQDAIRERLEEELGELSDKLDRAINLDEGSLQ